MANATAQEINRLFKQYREFAYIQSDEFIDSFHSDFDRLKKGIGEITREFKDLERRTAPSFNVFKVLNLARHENRTHSAFLSTLLSPEGKHSQGFLFLKSFLSYCAKVHPDFPLPDIDHDSGEWEVRTELPISSTGQGIGDSRLDIVIRSEELSYLCVIENKVDAYEQPGQIKRYSDWMKLQDREFSTQALIYLTPMGIEAMTAIGCVYFRLSYREYIHSWLESILPSIEASRLKEVIQQYSDLVHNL
jgi:hypothetical protein